MKKNIKKFIIIKAICVASVLLSLVVWEGYVREPMMDWFEGEEITFERPAPELTEYDKWLASSTTQAELELMFKRYQRDTLNAEITELESKR